MNVHKADKVFSKTDARFLKQKLRPSRLLCVDQVQPGRGPGGPRRGRLQGPPRIYEDNIRLRGPCRLSPEVTYRIPILRLDAK